MTTIPEIQSLVAQHYGVTVEEMTGPTRTERIVLPRHIAMYLSREILGDTLDHIAICFGGRDHATVMNAMRRVNDRMETFAGFRPVVEALKVMAMK